MPRSFGRVEVMAATETEGSPFQVEGGGDLALQITNYQIGVYVFIRAQGVDGTWTSYIEGGRSIYFQGNGTYIIKTSPFLTYRVTTGLPSAVVNVAAIDTPFHAIQTF